MKKKPELISLFNFFEESLLHLQCTASPCALFGDRRVRAAEKKGLAQSRQGAKEERE